MKKFLIASILMFSTAQFRAQTTVIPDPNFEQALIDLNYDSAPINGSVPTANINTIIAIQLDNKNISSLEGIEDFVSLEILLCNTNQIDTLDLTQNLLLTQLRCQANLLKNINIGTNLELDILDFKENLIDSIDISQNINLRILSCGDNNLLSLDVTQNLLLENIQCWDNNLSVLDVTNNNNLMNLGCSGNLLTNLNITQNDTLQYLHCGTNLLTNLDFTQNQYIGSLQCMNNQLTAIDVSQQSNLYILECFGNQLNCLNVKNGNNDDPTFSLLSFNNPDLTCIEVDDVNYSYTYWNVGSIIDTNVCHFSTFCGNNCTTGIESYSFSERLIYPNPSNTGLVQTSTNLNQSDIKVYSIEGKQIDFIKTNNMIDISENEKGVYLIYIDGKVVKYIYQN